MNKTARERMVYALIGTAHALEARLEAGFGEVGLSAAKFGVLDHLVTAGKPLSLSELAARVSCVRSNMTQLVDRLEADGLVRRVDDPHDRRGVLAALTDAGRERHTAGSERMGRFHEVVGNALTPEEQALLDQLLARLV